MPTYFDITPAISEKMGVFPGDVAFSREISLDFKKGNHLLLSSIRTTLHLGAHADGPCHYTKNGVGIGERTLDYYFGKCLVLHANVKNGQSVRLNNFASQWQNIKSWPAERILVRTGSFTNPDQWNHDFCSLDPALIQFWAECGIKLIGIDTPSIDPEQSKTLAAHNTIANFDLAILEGLVLDNIPEGTYSLVALPLRLANADASPVRAILFRDDGIFGEQSVIVNPSK